MKRKVLISPGFGAGWSTWCHEDENKRTFLFWEPLIKALEAGEKLTEDHPAIVSLLEKCPDEYIGGFNQLEVVEVEGQFIVSEYDGSEYIQAKDEIDWI